INNLFVWRSLKKIGNIIAKNITDLELNLLLNSKQISYFSDYPIDIAILPGTTSPLKCYTSISGKSLTPLSRQYQLEFTGVKSILIEDRCKVIIAECLNEEDNIRKFSDIGWDFIEKNNGQNKHIDFVFKNTNSVHKLKKFINENRDADILVISAHGHYDHARKITGIVVGDEFWDANDNDFYVPKIVIFSSCHVSSKGIGAINISDLFFRNGAICSIGTLIPIDVNKNIKLMSRLFVYITEALEAEDETSFDMIWTHVVSTNAILEILESSKKLHKWAMTRINGISPLEKFMLNHSKIQLNPKHIYRDSIKRLIEISKKDGKENHIKSVIKSQGIFPESVFYLLTGNPELISFCNSMSKKS
ncbi:MAG: hypothetical protein NUK62_08090, partial [Tenericutes bacterium]|nr:hypothetical protein [Mycoplasmatota bacterium]